MKNYIQENNERFLSELFELLRIPSISSMADHKPDMQKAAEKYVQLLLSAGCDRAEIYPTKGHPVVFAEKIIDKTKPTILVYAHYDVQPADPLNLWTTPPFEPQIRDGAIYARGANDDKGQGFMHVKAFEYLVKTNQLKCNVKFIIDGEEEIGSPSLPEWAIAHKEMLACDDILVSDTTMIDEKIPSINVGMRGLAYLEVEVNGPNKDLHSGHYGGAIANPVNVLCGMIDKLIDEKGRITVKGFYDDVVELTKAEREMLGRAPFDEEEFKHFLDIDAVTGEEGYTTMERTGIRPCLDVNGIWGGYTGEGAKTVLPSKATAKISCRLVPNQSSAIITKKVLDYFHSIAPAGVTVKAAEHHGGEPYMTPIDSIEYKAAAKAVETCFGKEPIPVRGGGSIPICALFEKELGLKIVFLGFGLDSDNLHSPNEKYNLENYYKGIETIPYFHHYFAEMKQ